MQVDTTTLNFLPLLPPLAAISSLSSRYLVSSSFSCLYSGIVYQRPFNLVGMRTLESIYTKITAIFLNVLFKWRMANNFKNNRFQEGELAEEENKIYILEM